MLLAMHCSAIVEVKNSLTVIVITIILVEEQSIIVKVNKSLQVFMILYLLSVCFISCKAVMKAVVVMTSSVYSKLNTFLSMIIHVIMLMYR